MFQIYLNFVHDRRGVYVFAALPSGKTIIIPKGWRLFKDGRYEGDPGAPIRAGFTKKADISFRRIRGFRCPFCEGRDINKGRLSAKCCSCGKHFVFEQTRNKAFIAYQDAVALKIISRVIRLGL